MLSPREGNAGRTTVEDSIDAPITVPVEPETSTVPSRLSDDLSCPLPPSLLIFKPNHGNLGVRQEVACTSFTAQDLLTAPKADCIPAPIQSELLDASRHVITSSALHETTTSVSEEDTKFIKTLSTNVSSLSSVSETCIFYAAPRCSVPSRYERVVQANEEKTNQESQKPSGQKRRRESSESKPVEFKVSALESDSGISSRSASQEDDVGPFTSEASTSGPIVVESEQDPTVSIAQDPFTTAMALLKANPLTSSVALALLSDPSIFPRVSKLDTISLIALSADVLNLLPPSLISTNLPGPSTSTVSNGNENPPTRDTPSVEIIETGVPVIQRLPPTAPENIPSTSQRPNLPNVLEQRSQHLARVRTQAIVCVFENLPPNHPETRLSYSVELFPLRFLGQAEMVLNNLPPENFAQHIKQMTYDVHTVAARNNENGNIDLKITQNSVELFQRRDNIKVGFGFLKAVCKAGNIFSISFYPAGNHNRLKCLVFSSVATEDIVRTLSNNVLRASGGTRKYTMFQL